MHRSYSRRVEGPSREWLAEQLQIELQSLQAELQQQQQLQLQGQGQDRAAESSPDMAALLQLRRQISAYQVGCHCTHKIALYTMRKELTTIHSYYETCCYN